nr:glutamyl-tRNA amidotransferase [Parerythrobacter lacustris]
MTIVGIALILAVPVTFMIANWVRKNVAHGETRFDENGKIIDNE